MAKPEMQQFAFADGGSAELLYWQNYDAEQLPASSTQPATVLVIPGSGCKYLQSLFPGYFQGLQIPAKFWLLHKRGIERGNIGEDCSPAYVEQDHPVQTIADLQEFVDSRLPLAGPLIIVGISEGAEYAVELGHSLAQQAHSPTALALVAHLGIDPKLIYQSQMQRYSLVDEVTPFLAREERKSRLHGRTYRYWQETFTLHTHDKLMRLNMPVFLGVGTADPLMPPAKLGDLQQHYQNSHVHMMTFSEAGHGLCTVSRCHLPDFFAEMERQLFDRSTLLPYGLY